MRRLLTFVLGLVVAVGLVGCDSSGGNESEPTAQVRFVHASPDAGPVDVVVDGETVADGVPFSELTNGVAAPSVASQYLDVPTAGDATVEVQDANGNTVISTTAGSVGLQEDAQYTIVVAGAVAAGDNTPQPIVLRDRFEANLGSNQVGIRLVHGSAGAGPVDIYLTAPNTDIQNASPIVSDFQFTDDFPGGFAGQFAPQAVSQEGSKITVTPAGQKEPIVLELRVGGEQGLPVQSGQYITGIAIDNPGADPPAGALIQVDTPDQ